MNTKINPEVAEILGAFIGDGWLESSLGAIYITGDKTEDKEYYDAFLGPLFSEHFSPVTPQQFPYWNVYGIGSSKKIAIEKCLSLGFQPGSKALVAKMPDFIMKTQNVEVKKAILRGIFDADGCIWFDRSRAKTSNEWKRKYHYIPIIEISSCSQNLLQQMKEILTTFGIESLIILKSKAGRKFNRNRHDSFSLKIRKIDHVKKWFSIIGSSNSRHQTRYAVWKKFGFLPPRTNINQRKQILAGKLDPKSFY